VRPFCSKICSSEIGQLIAAAPLSHAAIVSASTPTCRASWSRLHPRRRRDCRISEALIGFRSTPKV
jgi:hypothetical protein